MKRKIILYLILIALIAVAIAVLSILHQPKSAPVLEKDTSIKSSLDYHSVNQYVYEQNQEVCLFFYSSTDSDSEFVIDNMLSPILTEYGVDQFDRLIYVDLATLSDAEIEHNYIKNNWGFYRYPTFTVLKITNEAGLQTKDTLQWDAASPYSSTQVRQWLIDHQIIQEQQ